jgi:hypothetical protein
MQLPERGDEGLLRFFTGYRIVGVDLTDAPR